MSVRGYELLADWSRHGSFANTLEDVTSYVSDDPAIFVSYGRDQSRATTVATAGKLTFALNNMDRPFSPENTSSPIAGKVVPGTPVKLLQTHRESTRTLFSGVLDQFDVDPQAASKTFSAEVLDAVLLGAEPLSTELYSGLRTGDALNLILDAVGWPGDRDLDPGATVMPWWWEEGTNPTEAIERLVASEGPPAIAYVHGGTFIFRDRHHRTARWASQTVQGIYSHAIPPTPVGALNANPHFETDVSNWSALNGVSLSRSTIRAHEGVASMLMTPDGVTADPQAQSDALLVSPGESWFGDVWLWSPATPFAGVAIRWYSDTAGSAFIADSVNLATFTPDTWTYFAVTALAPANALSARLVIKYSGTPSAATTLFVDQAYLRLSPKWKIARNSFIYDHGLRHIVNTVNFPVGQRQPGDITEVWSTDAPITLTDGETKTILAETGDPFFNAITPVAGIDYDVIGVISVSLSRTSGQAVTLSVTASGGPAVLTRLALRAVSVPIVRTVNVSVEDVASISRHTAQPWPGQAPLFANVYDADAIARRIVATYATNRPIVTFQIQNIDDNYMAEILHRRISDRIRVINDSIGLDAEFTIERIAHTIRKLGVIHTAEFGCQVVDPVQPENIFTFDVAGKGFNDGAFGIEGIDNVDNTVMFDVAGRGFNDGVFAT